MSTDAESIALAVRGIRKRFGMTVALDACDLEIAAGEVHGLVGSNGAGKSTLVKIISGAVAPDGGSIRIGQWEGRALTPRHAQELGVATIYQEPDLIPTFGVAENIALGREPHRIGLLQDRRSEQRDAVAMAARVGLDARLLGVPVGEMSRADQQLVEIAKALHRQVRLILMDEPTAPLGPSEVERLETVIRDLRQAKVGILYISHRLGEVLRFCDRVTVLRDGSPVWTRQASELSEPQIVQAMIGRSLKAAGTTAANLAEVALAVRGLSQGGLLHDVTLSVRAGEVVGLAGLVGAGRSRLLRVLVGAEKPDRGTMELAGSSYRPTSPADALRRGVGLVPEDRQANGLFAEMTVATNIMFARPLRWPGGLVKARAESQTTKRWIDRLAIVPPRPLAAAATLSGGNQQKVMLARWLHAAVQVLLVDEPGQGVDVAGKREVASIIREAATAGKAVLVSASESEDLFPLADRILVMRHGRIVGELGQADASEETVLRLASGLVSTSSPVPARARP